MNINNLFFHIHYCNRRQFNDPWKHKSKLVRTLQHHELLLITGGKGSITIENKKHRIKEGMIFYIGPGVLQCIDAHVEEPICFLSVHFNYANVSFNDNKWDVRDESEMLSLHSMEELKDYYHVSDVFKKLVDSWYGKLPGYEFVAKALLQQLIFEIFQNIKKQNQNYSISLKVEKIIEYMHENIYKKVTLIELSEMVQLSPTYLSRSFKETTGYSVIEFFNKMKIDKAKELIIDGNKKIKEVAGAVGFTDEFYFSRLFKKVEGVSPSEFYSKNVHEV